MLKSDGVFQTLENHFLFCFGARIQLQNKNLGLGTDLMLLTVSQSLSSLECTSECGRRVASDVMLVLISAIDVTYLLEEGSGRKLRRRTLFIPENSFRK